MRVDEALKRNGWDGKETVAVPIVSVEPRSKKILGSRWEIRGPISKRSLKANSIWPQCDANITVSWNLSGKIQRNFYHHFILCFQGKDFKFSARDGALPSNFSDWKDSVDDDIVTFHKGDRILSWAEMTHDNGDQNLSMRLEVHLVDAKTVMIYLTRVPVSSEDLEAISEQWEIDKNSDKVPVTTCRIGSQDEKGQGLVEKLMVREPTSHKAGMGIYPLLEQVLSKLFSNVFYI